MRIDVSTRKTERITDFIAEEKPLHVFLNKAYYATMTCSPSDLSELAIGDTLTDGLLKSIDEVKKIDLTENRSVTSD